MHYKNLYNFRAKFYFNNNRNRTISNFNHLFYISRTFMASRGNAEPLKLQMPPGWQKLYRQRGTFYVLMDEIFKISSALNKSTIIIILLFARFQLADNLCKKNLAFQHFILEIGGLKVSGLVSRPSGSGLSPGWGHCVVFPSNTHYFHSASLHPGV